MKKLLSLVLCAAMLFSLAACGEPADVTTAPPTTQPPETTLPAPSAAEQYETAVAALKTVNDLTLDISLRRTVSFGPDTVEVDSSQDLILTNLNSGDFQARYSDQINFGSGAIVSVNEIFTGDTVYADVRTTKYQHPSTKEDFLSSHIPAQLLDAALYQTMELQADGSILLTGATEAEYWLDTVDAQNFEAAGTITLTESGDFDTFTYTAGWSKGGIRFSLEISSKLIYTAANITAPSNTASYPVMENGDYLQLLESASGYLLQTDSITASISEMIVSQAAAAVLTQQTQLDLFGSGNDQLAKVNYQFNVVDYSGATTSFEQEEIYRDGEYTITVDDGTPEVHNSVDSQTIRNYSLALLTDNMPSGSYIWDLTVTDLDGLWLLEYEFTDDYVGILKEYAQSTLLNSPTLLDEYSTSYRTEAANGYMAIDQFTGLPTAVGITYTGWHLIDGMEHSLTLELHQSIYAGSMSSYHEVTGETLLTGAELPQATPLFYHVTGPNGEEMWLMGTIHVGDERIVNLPQQIWDALDSSDALAVEVNTELFNQQAETDETLAQQISSAYFYSDGSSVAQHLKDSELYEAALKRMKASGSYHFNAPYMKPSLWAQSIENFYLRQSYNLTDEFGVDNQLMAYARESAKAIISIESGLAQVRMMCNYSDALQELLLASATETTQWETIDSVQTLYELWCAGDEAALIEYLRGDMAEVTAEEAALHEEYTKAISTDRNLLMLESAKEFLESGDVIFYAVGLAHLLAEDGLVFTLRDAGYTVELVPFN